MKLATTHSIRSIKNQQGIVLVVALLILVVMTILGVSMLSSSTLEERMASNVQAKNITFQAAESCIRTGLLPVNAPLRTNTIQTKVLSVAAPQLNCLFNGVPATVEFIVPQTITQQEGNPMAFDLGANKSASGFVLNMNGSSTLASGTSSSVAFVGYVIGAATPEVTTPD